MVDKFQNKHLFPKLQRLNSGGSLSETENFGDLVLGRNESD